MASSASGNVRTEVSPANRQRPAVALAWRNVRRVSLEGTGKLPSGETWRRDERKQSVLQMQDGLDAMRRLGLDTPPADGATADGFLNGTEENDVHELAIIEALKENGNEKRPVLVPFKREGESAGDDVDKQEGQEKDDGFFDVGGGPELRKLGDAKLCERPKKQGAEKEQVNDGRDERQNKLKDKDVRKSDPTKRAVFRTKEG